MFFTSTLISNWWYFFTPQLIFFFHLTLICFFSSKSCGFQSDDLRCFVFRWLRGKAKCCVLQKTLVELESKRGIGNRSNLESLLETETGIGVPWKLKWNRESKQVGNQSGIGDRESKQLGNQSEFGDRGPNFYLESVSHFWLGFETGFRTRVRF